MPGGDGSATSGPRTAAVRDAVLRLIVQGTLRPGLVMSLDCAGTGRPREIVEELRAVHLALAARDAEAAIAPCDRHRANSSLAGLRQLGTAI